jgi:hypothetical protein
VENPWRDCDSRQGVSSFKTESQKASSLPQFPQDIGLDILQRGLTSPHGLKVVTNDALKLRQAFRSIVASLGINPFQDLMLILPPHDNHTLFVVSRNKFNAARVSNG